MSLHVDDEHINKTNSSHDDIDNGEEQFFATTIAAEVEAFDNARRQEEEEEARKSAEQMSTSLTDHHVSLTPNSIHNTTHTEEAVASLVQAPTEVIANEQNQQPQIHHEEEALHLQIHNPQVIHHESNMDQRQRAQQAFIQSLLEENNRLKATIKQLNKERSELMKKIDSFQFHDVDAMQNYEQHRNTSSRSRSRSASGPLVKDPSKVLLDMQTVMDFLINYGGLSRFTVLDDNWHARNSTAAHQLFGFKNWSETKERLQQKFPDLSKETNNSNQRMIVTGKHSASSRVASGSGPIAAKIYRTKKHTLELGDASEWEKCLCVKLMDRTGLTAGRAALLFGRDKRTIVKWKERWCGRWGIERSGNLGAGNAPQNNNQMGVNDPSTFISNALAPAGTPQTTDHQDAARKRQRNGNNAPVPSPATPVVPPQPVAHPNYHYPQIIQPQHQHPPTSTTATATAAATRNIMPSPMHHVTAPHRLQQQPLQQEQPPQQQQQHPQQPQPQPQPQQQLQYQPHSGVVQQPQVHQPQHSYHHHHHLMGQPQRPVHIVPRGGGHPPASQQQRQHQQHQQQTQQQQHMPMHQQHHHQPYYHAASFPHPLHQLHLPQQPVQQQQQQKQQQHTPPHPPAPPVQLANAQQHNNHNNNNDNERRNIHERNNHSIAPNPVIYHQNHHHHLHLHNQQNDNNNHNPTS